MPEALTLAETSNIPTSVWRVKDVFLSLGLTSAGGLIVNDPAKAVIEVVLVGENGRTYTHRFVGVSAYNDIVALNKANLSAGNSLQKRILQKLVQAGVCEGAVTGSPD